MKERRMKVELDKKGNNKLKPQREKENEKKEKRIPT